MLKELQDVGLSEKEAKVYLAALEIGRATADQLAKQSKIVRSTTYVQIESLMKMGLMSTYEEGKKTYFAPESPEYLKRIFELKKKEFEVRERELNDFLPGLMRQFEGAGDRPLVRFFDGKEGIRTLREEILNVKEKVIYVVSASMDLTTIFNDDELTDYSQRRSKKGITTKLLYARKEGRIEGEPQPHTERGYIDPARLSLATDMVIFDNSVALMTLKGKLLGVLITSAEIKESMLAIFNFLWEPTEKH